MPAKRTISSAGLPLVISISMVRSRAGSRRSLICWLSSRRMRSAWMRRCSGVLSELGMSGGDVVLVIGGEDVGQDDDGVFG